MEKRNEDKVNKFLIGAMAVFGLILIAYMGYEFEFWLKG